MRLLLNKQVNKNVTGCTCGDTRKAKSKETRNKNVGMITHSIQSPYIFCSLYTIMSYVRGKISLYMYIIIFVHYRHIILEMISVGRIVYFSVMCNHLSHVSLLCAVLVVSLHLLHFYYCWVFR